MVLINDNFQIGFLEIESCSQRSQGVKMVISVMIKAAHVGQLLLLKKEKVWQRERIIFDSMIHGVIVQSVLLWYDTA